ncbi:MAG TPA: ABC transporter permease [Ferruginibacter sp.]|nr:ABC transporter permease [Ferruginibacter sp.]HMU24357.1 ABC transporter permease [Ferruginibacter sp.]
MNYFFKNIAYAFGVSLGVVTLVFIMFQGMGDPTRLLVGQSGDQKTIENIRKELHLDEPGWKQYLIYLNNVSPISIHNRDEINSKQLKGIFIGGEYKLAFKLPYLYKSYQTKKDTLSMIGEAFPGTLVLAGTAMLFACFFGVLLGVLAAVKKGTWLDTTAVLGSISGISAPSFFMAIVMAYLFGIVWHQYTGLPFTGSLMETDEVTGEQFLSVKNLILPALTLGIRPMSIIVQLTRSSMLDVLQQDYIRTAYAKGLSKTSIIFKHALRNALNPVITAVTGWFAELLAGSFFIEYIFGWKGIGKLTVDALEKLDYPVLMGAVLFSAFIFILINMLSDYLYKMADPRIGSS